MLTAIRRLGNSRGILIPKPLLSQAGLTDEAEILVEGNTLVVRKPRAAARSGWAEASRDLASHGGDAPVLPEIANEGDENLRW